MIDRYLLRYFLAVVDHGNFSAAARHCRVSQPTLSVGVARLEEALGRPLFTRTNRRVELTAAGARFLPHARRIEAEFAEGERAVRSETAASLVRIGLASTVPTAWAGRVAAAARGGERDVRVEIVEARPRDLRPLVERGRIDVGLGPVDPAHAMAVPLFTEGYALALPERHRLAGQAEVAAEAVSGEAMLVRRHCEALAEVSRHFTSRGIRPFMAARTTSEDHAAAYVRAGIGLTVLPRSLAADGIVLAGLAGFGVTRTIGLVHDPRQGGAGRDGLVDRLATAFSRA